MSRPIRIIQAETCYLVSHTTLTQHNIFKKEQHRALLLKILSELPERYRFSLHAYAFDENIYYLYLKTHKANIDKIMRQLGGLFTCQYQQLSHVEGSVFRGRYRAVVIEPLRYRQAILHFLHNAQHLASSHIFYTKNTFPQWLEKLDTSKQDDFSDRLIEVSTFFAKQRWPAILGSRSFKRALLRRSHIDLEQSQRKQLQTQMSIDEIIHLVGQHFRVSYESIIHSRRGRGQSNVPRAAAMMLCRDHAGYALRDIAKVFQLSHYASVSSTILRFKKAIQRDGLLAIVFEKIKRKLN